MNEKREAAIAALNSAGISYEITEHRAAFTMDDMREQKITELGEVAKNLFLRDSSGKRHFLVVSCGDKKADLQSLRESIGCSKLGFASAERLQKYLGLVQGEVTPIGLIFDAEHAVEVILDSDLSAFDRIGVHPCDNTATVWLTYADLLRFVRAHTGAVSEISI